jgi:uncharacterized delta-60 repeat protein
MFIVALVIGVFSNLSAQTPGELDLSFDAGFLPDVNGTVLSVASAGYGKVYIAGEFTTVRGAVRNCIARLNADGTVDTGFDPGTGATGGSAKVFSIAVQADGKLLIGGQFTSYGGVARNNIARLNVDGSLDTDFDPGSGANSFVRSVALQADGKVIIGGWFTTYKGVSRNRIARLNGDGSVDPGFVPGSGPSGFWPEVSSVAPQADGKVLIGGGFTTVRGVARNHIARFNEDGTLDTGFDPGIGASDTVSTVALQADGKVLIGGLFTSYNGVTRNRIARLNVDGSLDTGFASGSGADGTVTSMDVQENGKVLIAGYFNSFTGVAYNGIARLNVDGTLDTGFVNGDYGGGAIESVALQADGKVLIGGWFTSVHGMARKGIARLNGNGSLDAGFDPGSRTSSFVRSVGLQADGKMMIGGWFTNYGDVARARIARLNVDGSLDASFNSGVEEESDPEVDFVAVQGDGRMVIGGSFTSYNGVTRNRIARLNADGSLDTGFDPGSGANSAVYSGALQADGKVIIGGAFSTVRGVARKCIARINADGSLDNGFNPGSGANALVSSVAVQADGKVIIGGGFTTYDGVARQYIARLNEDGSLDTAFNPGSGANSSINFVAVQGDGKVLIGGWLTSYNGVTRRRIARLNADGSLDTSFDPGSGANQSVSSGAIQADGKVLIGGGFTTYSGVARNGIARLNVDGTLDTGFDPGSGLGGGATSVALQADGKVVVCGTFSTYDGVARGHLARVYNDPATESLSTVGNSEVFWARGGSTPEVDRTVFHLSTDQGATWTELGAGSRVPGGWSLSGLALPPQKLLRARGFTAGGGIVESIGTGGPAPIVTSVGSGTIPGLDAQQWITIFGGNFNAGAQVFLFDGVTEYRIPSGRTLFVDGSQIRIFANLTSEPAQWTVRVVNSGGDSSAPHSFSVNAPPVRPLPGLDFGTISPGETAIASFTVRNSGSESSPYSMSALQSPFTIENFGPGTLSPGQEAQVVIRYSPTAANRHDHLVVFRVGGESVARTLSGRSAVGPVASGSVFGTVSGQLPGGGTELLAGAEVSLQRAVPLTEGGIRTTEHRTLSDSQGRFNLADVPAGSYLVVVKLSGRNGSRFYSNSYSGVPVSVTEGESLEKRIELPSRAIDTTDPKNIPIVLVRGLRMGSEPESSYWNSMYFALDEHGFSNVWDPNRNELIVDGTKGVALNSNSLRAYLESKIADYTAASQGVPPSKVHFICHSMGGLIVRQLLHDNSKGNNGTILPLSGDVFMLGTPNAGTIVADHPLAPKISGWIGSDTRELQTNFVRNEFDVDWPKSGSRLFLVTGDRTNGDPILSKIDKYILQKGPDGDRVNDGVVTVLSNRGDYRVEAATLVPITANTTPMYFSPIFWETKPAFPDANLHPVGQQIAPLNHYEIHHDQQVIQWITSILANPSKPVKPMVIQAPAAVEPVSDFLTLSTPLVDELDGAISEAAIGSLKALVDWRDGFIPAGGSAVINLPVDTTERVSFILYCEGQPQFSLTDPNGEEIGPDTTNPLVSYQENIDGVGMIASYVIDTPAAGMWEVNLNGASAAIDGPYILTVESETDTKLAVHHADWIAPDMEMVFSAAFGRVGGGLLVPSDSTITAEIRLPNGATLSRSFSDLGTQGDGNPDDAIFGLIESGLVQSGVHEVLVRMDGFLPDSEDAFRRTWRGSFKVASSGGFLAGQPEWRTFDDDANGVFDALLLNQRVYVSQPGDYVLVAALRDEEEGIEIHAVTDFHRETSGTSTSVLHFEPQDLPQGRIFGPFELIDLKLSRRDADGNLTLLDRQDGKVSDVPISLFNRFARSVRVTGDMNFGKVSIGQELAREIVVHNDGWRPLEVSAIDLPPGFSSDYEGVVEAGGSAVVSIVFSPSSAIAYAGLLTVQSDALAGESTIALSGEGVAPAISVTGNGVEIQLGASTPNLGDHTDFGSVFTLNGTAVRTFTVSNSGSGPLSVGDVSLDGVHAADFTVNTQPEASIAPGDSTTFQITFDPGAIGIRRAVVSFQNNDSEKNPFNFAIQGTGTGIPQSIDSSAFDDRPRRVSDGPFSLGAYSTSGLPLNYEVLAGPVTVDAGGLVTPTGSDGAVTIRISQPGGSGYQPAPDVYVTFSIGSWHPFTKLVAGGVTYALRADGTLWTWGYANNTGHLADATVGGTGRVVPQQIGTASDWTDLAIGSNFGLGLRAGGALWAWGANLNGQLGDGTTTVRAAPVQVGSERAWANVSAGTSHTAAVAADGTLWTWGLNTNGQLGHGDTAQRTSPTQVGSATDWSRAACGSSFTWAIKTNGELWAWGANGIGQLGVGDTVQRTSPTRVGTATDWAQITVGSNYALGLKTDGTLWAWGTNGIGQFGNGGTVSSQVPVKIGSASDWSSVSACFATSTSAARKSDGSVWVWGLNSSGQLGDGTTINRNTPQRFSPGNDWVGIQVGQFHVTAWRADGTVWVAGEGRGFSGASPRALTRAVATAQTWLQLSGNGTHFHALREDGTLWAWGRNSEGAFGNGSIVDAAVPTQIGIENQWEQVASAGQNISGNFTLAVKKNGTLWGTGNNTNSKLGLGDTTTRSSFTQIGTATTWKRVAAGLNHGMAVRTDGSLWSWGLNTFGQLGSGDTTARTTPTRVGSDNDWQTVACGGSHSMGIKTNGTLWAWGSNGNGSLGLGDTTQRMSPVQVGSGTDWVAVACGLSHTLALKNDGTLWVWGVNSSGQLGLGNTAQRNSPVQVGTATHWTSISASINSSAALTADGTLWTAGENLLGQVGLGSTANVLSFTQAGSADLQHAAMGNVSLAAIQADGSFWTAGTAGPQVLDGGRDRTAVVPVQPQLSPQSIVAPPQGSHSVRVSAISGLPVSLLLLSGSAEIDGDEITLTGLPGSTVTVLAWQPGDERAWNAAPPVQLSLTRPSGDISIFAGTVGATELNTGESTVDFGAATVGAVPVTRLFTIRNDGDAALVLGEVVATGDWSIDTAGMVGSLAPGATTSFTAAFAPASIGQRAGGVTIVSDDPDEAGFTVAFTGRGMLLQNITFDAIDDQLANSTVNLSATGGGSGNPVTFAAAGPASIDGNNVIRFTGSGSVTVTASQAGNADYQPATPVARTFMVTKAGAMVSLANLAQTYNGSPRPIGATTSPSGKTVTFTYNGSSTPPIDTGSYTVVGTIDDPIYEGSATGTLVVSKAAQVLTFAAINDQLATATVNLSATGGGSGNPVTFAVTNGPASISGSNLLSFSGPGMVTVTASQAGGPNYDPATPVVRTFNVTKAGASLTLSRLHQVADGTARSVVVTTVPPDLDVSVTYGGRTDPPTGPGTYAVLAQSADERYEGSVTGTLVVDDPARLKTVPGGSLPALSALGALSVPTFQIGAYEVTGSQWAAIVAWAEANAGYSFAGAGSAASGDRPVTGVSWFDAAKWCNARTEWENTFFGRSLAPAYQLGGVVFKTGTPASPGDLTCDFGTSGYRLPTAAEWEYAARGGSAGVASTYPGGNTLDELGWYGGNSGGGIQPAGGKTPNGLDLYDFAGNAAEWTWDGPSGNPALRYLRGGAWSSASNACELTALNGETAALGVDRSGLRLARSISLALAAALDHPELEWESGGDEPWIAQTGTSHEGPAAAESGPLSQGRTSWMETTVEGPGNLRFRWKTEGAESVDLLTFSVDAAPLHTRSGIGDWEERLVEIGTGTRTLRWGHSQGSPSGPALAWVDAVVYEAASPPSLTTTAATVVTGTSAILGGEVTGDGGRTVTLRGVVYATAPEPTLITGINLPAIAGGTGSFTVSAADLLEGTTYFARAYATNNLGTSYGPQVAFTTRTSVVLIDGLAPLDRDLLPGDRHFFDFGLTEARFVTFATTGGAPLRATLRNATGGTVADFTGDANFTLTELLEVGNYSLEIYRNAGEGDALAYSLAIDATIRATVRPDLAVRASTSGLVGREIYLPTGQLLSLTSRRVQPVTGFLEISNRGTRPDRMRVSAGGGSSLFAVAYFGASGNVTSACLLGTYETPTLDAADAPDNLRVVITPNKRKLVRKIRGRTQILKKSITLTPRAISVHDPAIEDAATVRVQTR